MNPTEKCRVPTCNNRKTPPRKTCQRCRDAGAEQARKRRKREKEKRSERGEVVRPRAPNRPKPPLFLVPLPDGRSQLYTLRDWEHHDKSLFGDSSSEPSQPGVVHLVPVKKCARKTCYQYIPVDHPKNACGFCRQQGSGSKTVAGVKRKRDDSSEILDKLYKILEDYDLEWDEIECIEEIYDDIDAILDKSTDSIIVPTLVGLLDDPPKAAFALRVLKFISYRGKYSFSKELEMLLTKLLRLLSVGTNKWPVCDMVLSLFSNDSVRTTSPSQLRLAISRLISLLEGGDCNKEGVMIVVNELVRDHEYRHYLAPAIPRLIELLEDLRFQEIYPYELYPYDILHALLSFAKEAIYLRVIAVAVPRLIDLLRESDLYSPVINLLSELSTNSDHREITSAAIPLVIQDLRRTNGGRACEVSLEFIKNHCRDLSNAMEIQKGIPNIVRFLGFVGHSPWIVERVRDAAFNTLEHLSKQGFYDGAISTEIPSLVRLLRDSPRNDHAWRALQVLFKNALHREQISQVMLIECPEYYGELTGQSTSEDGTVNAVFEYVVEYEIVG